MDDGGDGVVTSFLEGAEDGHQYGLTVGPRLAAVAVAVFADNHCGTDFPFRMVVVEGNPFVIQEGER